MPVMRLMVASAISMLRSAGDNDRTCRSSHGFMRFKMRTGTCIVGEDLLITNSLQLLDVARRFFFDCGPVENPLANRVMVSILHFA